MRIMLTAAMLFASPATPPQPLEPTGKWQVDYADNMCVLSRTYGAGPDGLAFGIRPWPRGDATEIVLMQRGGYAIGIQTGKASLTLGRSATPVAATYSSYHTVKTNMQIVTLNVPQAGMADLSKADSIGIAMSGRPAVALKLTYMEGALKALSTCTDDLLRTWKIDPAESVNVATPAAPASPYQFWITDADYPADAMARISGGMTTIIWTIDTDGKVKNCSIAATTSGDPALDAAACSAITQRARYRPALDRAGKPIAVHHTRRVIWKPYLWN